MSYALVRVLHCDCVGCETPSPYAVQGEDDDAISAGWWETIVAGRKLHTCPACRAVGRVPLEPRPLVVEG